jgi:tripartite-type tricarboxylate transporter receptor subunit TctC
MKAAWLGLLLGVGILFCNTASGQYPNRSLRWIVPLAAGGPVDIMTRSTAAELAGGLGQPVIVENRPGAANVVGADVVAKSPPDGYTLLTASSGILVYQKFLVTNLPYDPQRDFALAGFIANTVMGLFVHSSLPVQSVQDLVAYAKANPGKLNYGSSGVGQRFHLATELFLRRTGTRIVHIPYKGAAQFLPELLAGRIDLIFFPPVENLLAQLKTGKLRILAMATEERFPALPDVPTLAEAGIRDFKFPDYTAVALAAGTPSDIVSRLNRELARAVFSPGVKKAFADTAFVPISSTPEQAVRTVERDIKIWGPILKSLGIKPD